MQLRQAVRRYRWEVVLGCVLGLVTIHGIGFAALTAPRHEQASTVATPTTPVPAPPFIWATGGGGPESDEARGVTMDPSGASLVAGTFQGTITLFAGNLPLQSRGMHDLFVTKLSSPNAIQWVRQFGGAGDDYAFDIVADDQGNSYVTGCFVGSVTLDGVSLTSTETRPATFPNCGGGDVFTLKLDPAGHVTWAREAGGPAPDGGNEVALDGQGNVLVAANTFGGFKVDSLDFPVQGNQDSYTLSYASDGALRWALPLAGAGADQTRGITGDASGNVLVAGRFTEMIQIGDVPLRAAGGSNAQDSYVAKLDPSGTLVWAKRFGGPNDDYARGIATDTEGNIYVSGVYTGTVQFDAFTLSSVGGSHDIFVVKLDPTGVVRWARSIGGSGKEEGCELDVTNDGSVTLAGEFSDQATIGTTTFTSVGKYDLFVARFGSAGTPLWAIQGGGSSQDVNYAIALDGTGDTITTVGTFQEMGRFNGTALTSKGKTDIFIAQQQVARLSGSSESAPSTFSAVPPSRTIASPAAAP